MEKIFQAIESLGGTQKNPVNTGEAQEFNMDESVKKLEAMFESKLPEEYIQLQKKFGGFAFKNNIAVKALEEHPALDDSQAVSLNYFYGLELDGDNSIHKKIRDYKDRIPSSFLPICPGEMNDLICIDLSPSNYGKICFWVSDIIPGEEEETFLVQNNITDLFVNAYMEEEAEDDPDAPPVDYDDEKFKHLNPTLLEMLKKSKHSK